MQIVALVADLMDQSRIRAALPDVTFGRDASIGADTEVVVIDLARFGDSVRAVRDHAPTARVICFGPHVDDDAAQRAAADGADQVFPRSRFFRDVRAAVVP